MRLLGCTTVCPIRRGTPHTFLHRGRGQGFGISLPPLGVLVLSFQGYLAMSVPMGISPRFGSPRAVFHTPHEEVFSLPLLLVPELSRQNLLDIGILAEDCTRTCMLPTQALSWRMPKSALSVDFHTVWTERCLVIVIFAVLGCLWSSYMGSGFC